MIPNTYEEAQPLVQDFLGLDDYGTYNKAPEPMTKITAEDYSTRLLHWQVIAIESRQPKVLGYSSLCIHWMNTKNGVGMSRAWKVLTGPAGGEWIPEYWLIGCSHNHMVKTRLLRTSQQAGFVHTGKCADCGYEFTYDSSG